MGELIKHDEIMESRISLDNFNTIMAKKPKNTKLNRHAGNSEYVPIEQVESDLDKYYQLWEWVIDDTQVMANAVMVRGTLSVLHPVTKTFIKRSGIGSVAIQVAKGANPTDFSQINATAMQKNVPAANAYAFKNAAKSLGNKFGRNLNREEVEFIPLHSTKARKEEEEKQRLLDYMEHHKYSYDDLTQEQKELYKKYYDTL